LSNAVIKAHSPLMHRFYQSCVVNVPMLTPHSQAFVGDGAESARRVRAQVHEGAVRSNGIAAVVSHLAKYLSLILQTRNKSLRKAWKRRSQRNRNVKQR